MNRLTTFSIPTAIVGLGALGLYLFGQPPEPETDNQPQVDQAVLVEVEQVSEWSDAVHIVADGEATTYRIVTLSSEVDGRILEKPEAARGGMFVREGEVLFRIDPRNYELEAERLKQQLSQSLEEQRATQIEISNTAELIALAQEELVLQDKQLARLRVLQQRGTANDREVEEAMKQRLLSRNALVTLQNQKRAAEQKIETQKAAAKVTQSELNRVNQDIERCTIRSPLTGRIVDDTVETGDYIRAGTNLAHISDSSRMEIRTKLQSEQLAWVWLQHEVMKNPLSTQKQPEKSIDPLNLPPVACEVAFEFEGVETIWDGYIARLEGTGIDRDTRTFPCRILVEEPGKTRVREEDEGKLSVRPPGLLSGMYVTVRIPVRSPRKLLRLPLEAVRPGGQVWVKRDGELVIVKTNPVYTFDSHVLVQAVESPLQVGDQVVISPLASVENKMPIITAEERAQNQSSTDSGQKSRPVSGVDETTQKQTEVDEGTSSEETTE